MRLLLAEDNHELADWLSRALTRAGFAVDWVADGAKADHLLRHEHYALAVLDIEMPQLDGLAVLSRLRRRGQGLPVLLLTARGTVEARISGLNAGADDYLAKPFDLGELDARLRALLRRCEHGGTELRLGQLTRHPDGYFMVANTPLALTPRELALLTALMYRQGRPVAKGQLFEQVFNLDDEVGIESIDLYIHRLRKKLVGSGVVITTLRGLGYVLDAAAEVTH
ncbi:transcriptional regulator TctD [Aeromonas cavernicola]|uniref:Transcriptional regulator TctD n=1 Tax=Aeromonas cavernicola TaxID=1006623 RepID=A0A2H9U0L7_9GAMM|nr:transcriptional regulator TctD [Aeromonas cavernicola]PJG57554.1 transcriptional regulator TctD [Aeromonas cavernicola]